MAKASKLPSGAWRTIANKTVNGKYIRKSFTVSPDDCGGNSRKAKEKSELLAKEWVLSSQATAAHGKTVRQALDDFIDDRSRVLSPSTITNYRMIQPMFESILDIYVSDIESAHIQRIINDWSISVKAKTIKNRVSLLLSALDYAECDKKFRLRYPQNNSKIVTSPDLEDVRMLIDAADDEFKPVLYLAAFGGLRRGEIAALKGEDVSRDMMTVFVHADIVLDDKKWVYKPYTKNGESGTIQLPKFVIDSLPDREGFLFDMNPPAISHKFTRIQKLTGLPFTLHTLRHFAASFRSDVGIPRKYIEELGRWKKGSSVLARVYDNTLTSSRKKYTQIANRYIEEHFEPKREAK